MMFLVTGASGVGKSTIGKALLGVLPQSVWACELGEVAGQPQWNIKWRQKAVEKVVGLAIRYQAKGIHTLLCGDPVPPGEDISVPSREKLHGTNKY